MTDRLARNGSGGPAGAFPRPAAATLVSVDVFDTVLVRGVGHPDGVFLLLGRATVVSAVTGMGPEAFARARKDAQDRAHATHGERVGLHHILAELEWATGLSPSQVEVLRECELALEERLLGAVPGAADWLESVRSLAGGRVAGGRVAGGRVAGGRVAGGRVAGGRVAGGRVVFASDTYLSSAFVRRRLEEHGLWRDGDGLYVSCEAGREKGTGRLFTLLARREGVRRRHVRHYGNDPVADLAAPRRVGVRATPVTGANLNRYELIMDGWRVATGGLSSLMAGASRMARLDAPGATGANTAVRDVAAGVAAPTLVAYVLWLLADAQTHGRRRLYFVSRDGEILLHLARRLAGPLGVTMELRYLYGSRQAWSAAALHPGPDLDLTWVYSDTAFLSVRTALARVGLQPENAEAALIRARLRPHMWAENLSRSGRRRLVRALRGGALLEQVLQRVDEARVPMVRYLEQEGLLGGTPCAVVDVGWSGRTGRALDSVLVSAGAGDDRAFYYLGIQRSPGPPHGPIHRAWLFDELEGRGAVLPMVPVAPLVEAFCSGSHGLVLGYTEGEGGVVPVLKSPLNDQAAACGLEVMRSTVDRFVDHLVRDVALADAGGDLRAPVAALLSEFGTNPTDAEARAWGGFPYGADPNEAYLTTLAVPYSARDAAAVLAFGPFHHPTHRAWPAASRRLSARPVAWVMDRPGELAARSRSRIKSWARLWPWSLPGCDST